MNHRNTLVWYCVIIAVVITHTRNIGTVVFASLTAKIKTLSKMSLKKKKTWNLSRFSGERKVSKISLF